MFYEKPLPFHVVYPYADMLDKEAVQDHDMQRIKSYYPKTASKIQACVEDTCDRMDYEGSLIYDEYPDRLMISQICDSICNQVREQDAEIEEELQSQAISCRALRELTEILFLNEIFHRRCRRRRCRRYY